MKRLVGFGKKRASGSETGKRPAEEAPGEQGRQTGAGSEEDFLLRQVGPAERGDERSRGRWCDDETLQRRERTGASEKQARPAPSLRFSVAPLEGCQAINRPPGGGVSGGSRIPSALAPGRKKARRRLSGPQRLGSRLPTDVGQQRWRQEPAITGKVRARPPAGTHLGAEGLREDGCWGWQQRKGPGLRVAERGRAGRPVGASGPRG